MGINHLQNGQGTETIPESCSTRKFNHKEQEGKICVSADPGGGQQWYGWRNESHRGRSQDWNTENFEGDKEFVVNVEVRSYRVFSCSEYVLQTMNISHIVPMLLKGDAS